MGSEPRSFLCAPGLRIEAQERMTNLQLDQLNGQIEKIEQSMERLEKRLWLTVYGVAGVVLSQAALSLLEFKP